MRFEYTVNHNSERLFIANPGQVVVIKGPSLRLNEIEYLLKCNAHKYHLNPFAAPISSLDFDSTKIGVAKILGFQSLYQYLDQILKNIPYNETSLNTWADAFGLSHSLNTALNKLPKQVLINLLFLETLCNPPNILILENTQQFYGFCQFLLDAKRFLKNHIPDYCCPVFVMTGDGIPIDLNVLADFLICATVIENI